MKLKNKITNIKHSKLRKKKAYTIRELLAHKIILSKLLNI